MYKWTVPVIHIIGLPGAGKTTLARRLSKEELHTRNHGIKFPGSLFKDSIAF